MAIATAAATSATKANDSGSEKKCERKAPGCAIAELRNFYRSEISAMP